MARLAFRAIGVKHLEPIDLATSNGGKPTLANNFNVVYLSGGNPLRFRDNLRHSGFQSGLREFAVAGGLIVGASGGAMQITPNISLYRLLTVEVGEVMRTRNEYEGLAFVTFEILPHLNKHDARFLGKARRYSENIEHYIVAVEDSGALMVTGGNLVCFGRAVAFHRGIEKRLETAIESLR